MIAAPPFPACPRTVAVVGNAPAMGDHAAAIDAADWVVRFNNAAGFGGRAGTRTTHLALVNHGGQMREWLADPRFAERPVLRAAAAILLPFARKADGGNRDGEDGRDWTEEAERCLAPLGVPVVTLPDTARLAVLRDLAHHGGRAGAPPSTGTLITHHLAALPDTAASRFDVYGFGFEGWSGHAWDAERAWFEAQSAGGRFRLHPPG